MRLLLAVAAVLVVGCGSASPADAGPVAGAACTTADSLCTGSMAALFCEGGTAGGTWKAFSCPGGCDAGVCRALSTTSGLECPTAYLNAIVCTPDDRMVGSVCLSTADGGTSWGPYACQQGCYGAVTATTCN